MDKRRIIIDTDPGIDDAVAIAIALASEKLDVRLITTACGNVSLEKVTYNAMRLIKFFESDVKVAKGAEMPLIAPYEDAANVHGPSGLEGFDFEEPNPETLHKEHAVLAMREEISSSQEKTTLLCIGALTNIALLFKIFPEVKAKIEEIVIMGGSLTRGNKGVMSEYNFATDPEAAKIVMDSGLKIALAPLDVGLNALVYPDDSEKIRLMNKTGEMMYCLFKKYRGGSFSTGLKMYDSTAVAYLLSPDMYEFQDLYVDIELNKGYTYGCSVIDVRGYLKKEPNVKVCMSIDKDKFKKWFLESIAKCV